jgi:small subunit ribosomal protein S1
MPKKKVVEQLSEFETLVAKHGTPIPAVGDIVEGTVLAAGKQEVLVDIDGLGVGVVRGVEVQDESGEFSNMQPGARVSATVLELDNERGELELSFRFAGHQKAWGSLKVLSDSGEMVTAKVTDANKGGLMVRVGNVAGFLPVSQLSAEHYPRVDGGDKGRILVALKAFIGQEIPVRILDVNDTDNKLIVSEKAAVEEQRRSALAEFAVGQTVQGKVSGVVDFGIFVEFGEGLEGLAHISELAWRRLDHPKELFSIGQTVEAKIIGLDGTRISLSLKALQEDPWQKAAERYTVGQAVKGTILKINPFGAFIELDSQIHGLCHISELEVPNGATPEATYQIGKAYEFRVISLEPESHRLGLSVKALSEGDTPRPRKPRGKKVIEDEATAETVTETPAEEATPVDPAA